MAVLAAGPEPESVKAARDFTSQTLLYWGLRALIADATVVVSELVTNALRYGAPDGQDGVRRRPVEVVLWCRDGQLVCVVVDSSPSPPVPARSGLSTEDGRGLHVVQALSSRWGWTILEIHRKAVWAVIRARDPVGPRGAPSAAG